MKKVTRDKVYEYKFRDGEHYVLVFSNYSGELLGSVFFDTKEQALTYIRKQQ